MNGQVISGLVLRYTYLYRRSLPRLIETVFWPVMELLVWGFLSTYLQQLKGPLAGAINFILGAMIFWEILYRTGLSITVSFLEDVWARNLLNIFVAPVRRREFLIATYFVGLIKTSITATVLTVLAALFYHFNLTALGFSLVPFFINLLLMGWALGMFTTAFILRYGQGVEALAWGVPFLLQPFVAVFYPVAILPVWLQPISLSVPATHVFEGMRAVLAGGAFPWNHLLWATGLNVLYFIGAGWFFAHMFQAARERGLLAKIGTQ